MSNLFVINNCNHHILKVFRSVKSYFLKEMVAKLHTAAILFGHIGHLLGKEQSYIFIKCFIVFLDPENLIIDTRIKVLDTINVELCVKIYVAANGGQYGRHLENVASYDIQFMNI